MYQQEFEKLLKALADKSVFALLIVETEDGKVILRPIGGEWGSGIIPAIEEMDRKYPGCKMKLLERNYRDWFEYFQHVIPKERMI
ncbi:hypothetical protein [Caldicellulosiruptor morganii]|uniref:Uncharacterized protein n=1 Tax=Caldicellulosiruptor morganii TaxID=1387555 RepID=A0ABY7BM10_9FIRM|nr:hypothetical protein [Caldicellulosiruptor morganii]WAM33337.1 hypothetical protein OTK00_001832 [Caldicellulosiruptor morganii]